MMAHCYTFHELPCLLASYFVVISVRRIDEFGEMAPECAQAYFVYGNALISKEEETPTDTLLGNVEGEENAPPPADYEVSDEEECNGNEDSGGYDDEDAADADDLQVAFEVLEVRSRL